MNTSATGSAAYTTAGHLAFGVERAVGSFREGEYTLTLLKSGSVVDTLTLVVGTPRIGNLTVGYTGANTTFDSGEELGAAMNNGSIVTSGGIDQLGDYDVEDGDRTVLHPGTVVLAFDADRLSWAVDTNDSDASLAAFAAYLNRTGGALRAVQTNPTPSRRVKAVDLLDPDAGSLYTDPANDTYYLVADTRDLRVVHGDTDLGYPAADGAPAELYSGDRFAANLTLNATGGFDWADVHDRAAGADPASAETSFVVVDPDATLTNWPRDERVVLAAGEPVRGRTTLAPGSTLVVEAARADGTTTTRRVTVGANGTFDASLGTANATDGTRLTVTVRLPHRSGGVERRAVVRDPAATLSASVRGEDERQVAFDATVSHRSLVVVAEADGDVVGVHPRAPDTGYTGGLVSLAAADPGTLTVTVYRDVDRDGRLDAADVPYPNASTTVEYDPSESGRAAVPRSESGTSGPSVVGSTVTDSDAPTESSTPVPGFGVVVAAVAVAGATLVLSRRAN
ncbi:BGTF surface domain-containing protein [Halobaculum marinum]|uniref:BGTF surface domain-containing protein n=1 Tax=Halobaculum marinum TaxID=3031996 RepID=A0ABD5WSV5_9EURY|nr:BGTF surface domain-containing protein [Halobaculum sp. DT55]